MHAIVAYLLYLNKKFVCKYDIIVITQYNSKFICSVISEKELKMKALFALLTVTVLAGTAIAEDVQVFNWKTKKGSNAYSDVPRNLQMGRSNVVNVRTGTVAPPPLAENKDGVTNLVEAQQKLNEQIAAENKRREEEAAKRAAEVKEENCKAARMNRANAEHARNKAELIPKFDQAIQQYCN